VDILGASEATVPRDINSLADAGQIRPIGGGAEALTPRNELRLVGVPFEMNREIARRRNARSRSPRRISSEMAKASSSVAARSLTRS
jgi:DeoR family transcriptional regulator, ulaG and ulaABCDEF operon transcriptional repressor